ncbi:MAG: hypothetical protein LBL56_01965, partial [Treponema sp.]|nr:hypothetical protein [Treponema sp.]
MRVLRIAILILVIELHALAIVSINFDVQAVSLKEPEPVRVMKLTDLTEYIPPSPDTAAPTRFVPTPSASAPLVAAPLVAAILTAPPVPEEPAGQEEPPILPEEPVRQEEPPTLPEEPARQEEPPTLPEEAVQQEELPTPPEEPVRQEEPPMLPDEHAWQEKLPAPPEEPAPQERPPSPPAVPREETPREEAPPDRAAEDMVIRANTEPAGRMIAAPEGRIAVNTPAGTAEAAFENSLSQEDRTAVEHGDPAAPPAQYSAAAEDEYLPAHRISVLPQFPVDTIRKNLIYPPAARRSVTEGRVVLELFVDRTGIVRRIDIIQEEPAG